MPAKQNAKRKVSLQLFRGCHVHPLFIHSERLVFSDRGDSVKNSTPRAADSQPANKLHPKSRPWPQSKAIPKGIHIFLPTIDFISSSVRSLEIASTCKELGVSTLWFRLIQQREAWRRLESSYRRWVRHCQTNHVDQNKR